jgi:hypothetical protein
MAATFFALLAALIAGFGARDQVLLARLSAERDAPLGVLLAALGCAALSCAVAGWAAGSVAGQLVANARLLIVAVALAFAAFELLFTRSEPALREPTLSLGALALVLLARQISDATRFLVFAIGLATAAPLPAALGGGAGSALALGLGWFGAAAFRAGSLRQIRRGLGVAVLGLSVYVAMHALG